MNLKTFLLVACLFVMVVHAPGQGSDGSSRPYALLNGSRLTDDCPVCDRVPIVVGMTGTFTLRLLEQNPLFSRYETTNISFHAGAAPGPEYKVEGSALYQVGGELVVGQDMFMNVGIDNGVTQTGAFLVNTDRTVQVTWPRLTINLAQTNGTITQVYYLDIVAAPVPRFTSLLVDRKTGDVQLEWEATGATFQVERAPSPEGPFEAVAGVTKALTYTDPGAATNQARLFYRLLEY